MPAQFPVIGHGDPWKLAKKDDDPTIGSGDIIHAMRQHKRHDAFRAELNSFLDTRLGTIASSFIIAAAIFTLVILAVRAAGYSI